MAGVGAVHGQSGANVGTLTCNVAGGSGVGFGSSKELRCLFTRTDGRGERGLVYGRDSIEADFTARPTLAHARAMWPRLSQATRDMYQGFAAAVNDYVAAHPGEFVATIRTGFEGWDVLANEIPTANIRGALRLLERHHPFPTPHHVSEAGSNAWASTPRASSAASTPLPDMKDTSRSAD